MYRVIVDFADLQDGKHYYHGGATYPRDGYVPGKDRIAQLLGSDNLMHRPLIVEVKEQVQEKEPAKKKTTRRRKSVATQ